ncbi:hypothetical protein PIB30_087533 [Stylosanthes scabra]|uniref:Putative plant transposon protein domain-containing protein n=1 Tax=Stylosanthes scabra TaxID=79078 RepID=A0ABU6XVU1_9FABA|nr:hypothetical protein [Stylosanthes scabra]
MTSSSAKKRKGKSAQNYDVAKFKSLFHEDHYNKYTKFREVLPEARIEIDGPEFAPMKAQINERKWQRLTKPMQLVTLLLENSTPMLGSRKAKGTFHLPTQLGKNEKDYRINDILRDLYVEGAQWVFHDDGRPHFLRRTDLQPMARGWNEFATRSIMPTGNHSEVNLEWAMLIHSIIIGEDIQVDEIIAEQIYKFANKTRIRTKLPLPGVIQLLCNEAKVSIPEDTMISVEPHINSKWMERVKKERASKREAHLSEQQNEATELPQVPKIQQGFPSNFMAEFNNAMAAMQLQNNQRWDAFQQRFDADQEENRKSFSYINERMDKMDYRLNFLCNTNQFMNEDLLYPYQQTELTMREMQGRGIPVTIENLKINRQRIAEMQRVRQESKGA